MTAIFLILFLLGWPIGNQIGWWFTARPDGDPWNWRTLVSCGTYFNWLTRR